MPGPQTVAVAVVAFAAVALRGLAASPSASSQLEPAQKAPESLLVRGGVLSYFALLVAVMACFRPEEQVSTGPHQVFGPCNATDVDLMGYVRDRYICRERYPDWYFSFDCPAPLAGARGRWAHVDPSLAADRNGTVSWYTVCGRPHESFELWMAAVAALALCGSALFVWAFTC